MIKASILVVSLLLTLTGCNAKNADSAKTQGDQTEQTTKNNKKMGTIHLTKEAFLKKVVNYETSPNEWKYLGDKPCLIDFYADWCGPCKAVAPILEELAKTYDGQIYIYKINTDEEQELAGAFGIRSIPSLLFVPMEGKPQMSMGALPKNQMVESIDKILLLKN
jgi:thioredoxin